MINIIEPIILKGEKWSLIPLSFEHHNALVDSAKNDELRSFWYIFLSEYQKMYENIVTRLGFKATCEGMKYYIEDEQ